MRALKTLLKRIIPARVARTARSLRTRLWRSKQRAFDRRYGVETGGLLQPDELDVGEDQRKLANRYEATPRAVFLRLLRSIPLDHRRFTFVDIGSGKGAVLLYASAFPFQRIVGVEFSQYLSEIAEANIRRYPSGKMRCRDVRTLCLDAMDYPLPEEPLVLYLANPFKADFMNRLVANIERSARERPRELIVMSFNPTVEDVLDRAGWLERVGTGWNHAMYRSKILAASASWKGSGSQGGADRSTPG